MNSSPICKKTEYRIKQILHKYYLDLDLKLLAKRVLEDDYELDSVDIDDFVDLFDAQQKEIKKLRGDRENG